MSDSGGQFDELGRLTAALCDGEITSEETARLEELVTRSDAARRFFLQYTRLHSELYWEHACNAEAQPDTAAPRPVARSGRRGSRWAWAALAIVLLLAVTLFMALGSRGDRLSSLGVQPATVARLSATLDAAWTAPPVVAADGRIAPGTRLDLARGLAELQFNSGATVILEGPAVFEPLDFGRARLHVGTLTATVPHAAPGAADGGFTVETPVAQIVDRGTQFGVAVRSGGRSEIQVFEGSVEVAAGRFGDHGPRQQIHAGQAVEVVPAEAGEQARIEACAFGGRAFVRALSADRPADGAVAGGQACSVERLRAEVSRHPHLIHHYPFEGRTPGQRCRDLRGDLHLSEVVMAGGRDDGAIDYQVPGFDRTTTAIRPFRAGALGNTRGVSLQSQGVFEPPPAMTVELLLNYALPPETPENSIAVAIGTRETERKCGFLIAAVDAGQLVHLLDGAAPWTESGLDFIPGDWYYVASTLAVKGDRTRINTYAANLTRGEPLAHVVRDQWAPGVPAASRLGIGKGFTDDLAHAYPWSGSLDEVAIYDAVLDAATLKSHREALRAEKGE